MYPLKRQYEKLIEWYDDEEDMCNQLGLNYDEIWDYDYKSDEDAEW